MTDLKKQYQNSDQLGVRIRLHQLYSVNPQPWVEWIYQQMNLPDIASILEVGTGAATLWTKNIHRVPAGWQITLSDFSAGMLDDARKNLGAWANRFSFVHADAQELPFADAQFDGVIANHMLYHVPDLDRAISEFHRVLRPGGQLWAATNGDGHMKDLWDLLTELGFPKEQFTLRRGPGFYLENGGEKLASHFPGAKMVEYQDGLEVPEVDILVDYVRSAQPEVPDSMWEDLRSRLKSKLETEG